MPVVLDPLTPAAGIPLTEGFFESTNPATFARGKEVFVYERGTEDEVQLYADEALTQPISQPLITDKGGRPHTSGSGEIAWLAPTACDIVVDGQKVPWTPAALVDLSGYQATVQKGVANGYASLEAAGKVPASQLPSAVMEYQGTWNASTNTPKLEDGKGSAGDVYRVSVAGERSLGSGTISFEVGDYAVYNGSVWEKSDTTDAVASVNGKKGVVSGLEESANKDTNSESADSDVNYPSTKAARAYSNARRPFIDLRDYVGLASSTSDKGSKVNEALTRAFEYEKSLLHAPWQVVIGEPAGPESFVEWFGHVGRSGLKVGDGSNCAAIRSPRYGAGGTTGGTERTTIRSLDIDGNFAKNGSTTDPCVALDGIRPTVDLVTIKNGVVNLSSMMSRAGSPGTEKLEDGTFTRIGLKDPQKQNFLFEGPHDSSIDKILGRSDVATYANIDLRTVCVLENSHFYGNAQYACRQAGGDLRGCILEGGRKGQLLITTGARHAWDCFLFNGGGADGGIGVVLGEEGAGNIFDVKLFNFHFEKINTCVLRCNGTVSRLLLTGFAEGPEGGTGKVWDESAKEPKADCDFRGLRTRNLTDNTKCRPAEQTFGPEGIHAGRSEVLEILAGEKAINQIQFGETGQVLTLFFKEARKIAVTGNVRLAGGVAFEGTPNDTLTMKLRPDGNWYETGRAVI